MSQPDCNTGDGAEVHETATETEDHLKTEGTLRRTLVFSEPGDASLGTIAVPIVGDSVTEPPETFKVVIGEAGVLWALIELSIDPSPRPSRGEG